MARILLDRIVVMVLVVTKASTQNLASNGRHSKLSFERLLLANHCSGKQDWGRSTRGLLPTPRGVCRGAHAAMLPYENKRIG